MLQTNSRCYFLYAKTLKEQKIWVTELSRLSVIGTQQSVSKAPTVKNSHSQPGLQPYADQVPSAQPRRLYQSVDNLPEQKSVSSDLSYRTGLSEAKSGELITRTNDFIEFKQGDFFCYISDYL